MYLFSIISYAITLALNKIITIIPSTTITQHHNQVPMIGLVPMLLSLFSSLYVTCHPSLNPSFHFCMLHCIQNGTILFVFLCYSWLAIFCTSEISWSIYQLSYMYVPFYSLAIDVLSAPICQNRFPSLRSIIIRT